MKCSVADLLDACTGKVTGQDYVGDLLNALSYACASGALTQAERDKSWSANTTCLTPEVRSTVFVSLAR